jgi:hypothetical protein
MDLPVLGLEIQIRSIVAFGLREPICWTTFGVKYHKGVHYIIKGEDTMEWKGLGDLSINKENPGDTPSIFLLSH